MIPYSSVSRHRNGFSLLELLLVLGVMALLLVAAFVLYPRIRDYNQGRDQARHSVILKDNIQSLFGRQGAAPDYTGLNTAMATADGLFPKSLWPSNTTITQVPTPYDGRVLVGSTNTTATDTPKVGARAAGSAFYIRFTQVPSTICVALVSQAGAHFDGVIVDNFRAMTSTGLNMALVADKCDSATGPVTVTFLSI